MNKQEIDNLVIKYQKIHKKIYLDKLIKIFKPLLENKAWKLKRTVSDPAVSFDDIYQDLIINFIHTLNTWNPKRKCSFKTFLIWHNSGNPVRAKKRGGINYLFRKGKKIYYITSFEEWSKRNGQRDGDDNDSSIENQGPLSFYRTSK